MSNERRLAAVGVTPDFMTAARLPIELKAELPQFAGRLLVLEARQSAHYPTPIGIVRSNGFDSSSAVSAGGSGSPCARHDSAILRATSWAISATSTMLRPSATN